MKMEDGNRVGGILERGLYKTGGGRGILSSLPQEFSSLKKNIENLFYLEVQFFISTFSNLQPKENIQYGDFKRGMNCKNNRGAFLFLLLWRLLLGKYVQI